jgi:ADP-heptose:LPS heptosyltransferase
MLAWKKALPELPVATPGDQHLVVLRVDDIGDYLLFRDALRRVALSPKWAGHQITVVGNAVWKPLVEHLDSDLKIDWIWLNKNRWFSDASYREQFLLDLHGLAPGTVWVPCRTRHVFLEETLLQAFRGIPIVVSGSLPADEAGLGGQLFSPSRLENVIPEKPPAHEWAYNGAVAGLFAGNQNSIHSGLPAWEPESGKPYLLFFPGASAGSKRWAPVRFAQLARALWETWHIPVWLAGSPTDRTFTIEIMRLAGNPNWMTDRSGTTTLPQLLDLVRGCRLLVSNDTSAAHMGALAGVPTVAVCNGNKTGRFFPYPATFDRVRVVYPPGILEHPNEDRLPLRALRVETVVKACAGLLGNQSPQTA